MEELRFNYKGDCEEVVDKLANKMSELPYDVVFTQFKGNEEAFFSFCMESYYEEYNAMVISMVSLRMQEFNVDASVVSDVSSYSSGMMDALALDKQLQELEEMMTDCGFKVIGEPHHDHHSHDKDDFDEEDCDCACDHHHIH